MAIRDFSMYRCLVINEHNGLTISPPIKINYQIRGAYNLKQKLRETLCDSLKMTIESIGDSIITTNNFGIITTFNKAAENLTEWLKEDAIGIGFNEVFNIMNYKSREVLQIPFSEIITNNFSTRLEEDTILISKNGKEYFISATISNIMNDRKHKVIGVVILLRDITRLRMLQDEVRKEKEQAQAANIEKSAFIANMSHEIRTPLNGIEGMIDLTLLTQLTQEQIENLTIAKGCSNSLMEVINNILDFSKIEAGKMFVKKTSFRINDLVEITVKTNIAHAKEKGIEFISKINLDSNEKFRGDYGKIQQILNNLISNAIKFTNQGSVSLVIEKLSKDWNGTLFGFSVIDTGIGISEEDNDKLFKSFSQVDGTNTRKYGGTGLGLIISKKLAEIMGGDLSVESIKDKGSTFSLTIRMEQFNDIEMVKENRKETDYDKDNNNSFQSGISREVLIVEDNKANQVVLTRMCSLMNHKVKIAEDGKKALEILNSETFDVILMDIQMPVMNGIEATKIIRENEKKSGEHIPIIALTAYALVGDREKFLNLGMDDYLSKPVKIEDLYKCIDKVIIKKSDGIYHDASYYLKINETDNNIEDKKTELEKLYIEINRFRKLIEQEDYNGCEKATHIIKEYSLKLKSIIMKNASFRAELAARRKDINGLKEQILIIDEEYNRIKRECRKITNF